MSYCATTVGAVLKGIVSGKSIRTLERPAQGNEFGILKVSAVTWGEFRPAESKAMPFEYDPGDCPRAMDGDILISRANTRELVGAPVMVHGDHPRLLLSDKLLKLIPDETVVDSRYLVRALRSAGATLHFSQCAGGSSGSITNITQGDIRSAPLPLPPLPEQRRNAAILDQADALRAKRREALAQLDSLTQSIFIEMFGDPGLNPKSWPELQLGELIVGTPNNGIFKKNEEYGTGTPVVWVEELFKGNEIDCSSSRALLASTRDKARYGLRNGDLLFCRSSLKLAGIGYNNVYLGEDDEALFECHVIRVSPNQKRIEPRFLNYALRLPSQRQKLFKFAKTVTMTTIDQDGLLKVSVPVPTLDLQRKFCRYLSAVEVVRRRQMATVAELDALFASLQHRAFAGQLS